MGSQGWTGRYRAVWIVITRQFTIIQCVHATGLAVARDSIANLIVGKIAPTFDFIWSLRSVDLASNEGRTGTWPRVLIRSARSNTVL